MQESKFGLLNNKMSISSPKHLLNGHLTRTLKELEYAGFVARESNLNAETGKPARIDRYRICDNYTRFYLHFIEPNRKAISGGLFRFSWHMDWQ